MMMHEETCPLRQYEGHEHEAPLGTRCQCGASLKKPSAELTRSASVDLHVFQAFADRLRKEAIEVAGTQGMQMSRVDLRASIDGWSMTITDMKGMEVIISGRYSDWRPR